MARSIYITSAEGDTGKSTVALGLVDLLTRTVARVGVFRPVARSVQKRDYVLELPAVPGGRGPQLRRVRGRHLRRGAPRPGGRPVAHRVAIPRGRAQVRRRGHRGHGLHRRRGGPHRAGVQRPDRGEPGVAGAARHPGLQPSARRGALDGRGLPGRAAHPARRGDRPGRQPVPRPAPARDAGRAGLRPAGLGHPGRPRPDGPYRAGADGGRGRAPGRGRHRPAVPRGPGRPGRRDVRGAPAREAHRRRRDHHPRRPLGRAPGPAVRARRGGLPVAGRGDPQRRLLPAAPGGEAGRRARAAAADHPMRLRHVPHRERRRLDPWSAVRGLAAQGGHRPGAVREARRR